QNVDMTDELDWNTKSESVVRVSRIAVGSVVLEEDERPAPASEAASALLLAAARSRGPTVWDPDGRLATTERRLSLLRAELPELGISEAPGGDFERVLEHASGGLTKLADLTTLDLAEILLSGLSAEQRSA